MSAQTPTQAGIYPPHDTDTVTSLTYTTNAQIQRLSGMLDEITASILINGSDEGVSYYPYPIEGETSSTLVGTDETLEVGEWSIEVSLTSGVNTYTVRAIGYDSTYPTDATISITYVADGSITYLIDPPTGISMTRHDNRVEYLIKHDEDVSSPDSIVIGYNVYASTYPGGGLIGYTLLNSVMISTYQDILEEIDNTEEDVDRVEDGNTITETLTTVNTILKKYRYTYVHDRKGNTTSEYPQRSEAYTLFNTIDPNVELYYVSTAIAYDPDTSTEYESTYSQELTSLPMVLTTKVKDLTPRPLQDIQVDLINEILRVQSTIDVRPGTVTRDIHIDPPASEINRLWLIVDFVHRCQSFLTLLQIDDPDKTGESVEVSKSKYKVAIGRALSLNNGEVQTLIDEAFTKKATDLNTLRMEATKAKGYVTLGRRSAPKQNLTVSKGSLFSSKSGVAFVSTVSKVMYAASAGSYYNSVTGLYEITIPVEASVAGTSSNLSAEALINTNASGFAYVTNRIAMYPGTDKESNSSLAERAMLAFASVDRGTSSGYLRTALDTNGVSRAQIVEAGDTLMMRDWDEVREKHIGGKVDVWIQGESTAEVSETFAFEYSRDLNVHFQFVGEASNLRLRTTSENVTVDTPIFAMLDDADLGYGLRNATTGQDFDLTGVEIIDYRTIQLDTDIDQPTVTETNLIVGDYKYQSSEPYILRLQPVKSISGIVSDSSTLTSANYTLIKTEDPLLYGYSTSASDSVSIVQSGGVPTGDATTITGEEVTLVGVARASLAKVGIDVNTIVVTNTLQTVTYLSTGTTPDYYVLPGTSSTTTKLYRNPNGRISDGQKIIVSYQAEENFTITYSINELMQRVFDKTDAMRHVTADVIVKQSIENKVDVAATIILKSGADQADADIQIRTAVSKIFHRLQIGENIHQSDVIHAIESVPEVRSIIVPLTRLHKQDGSLILREPLSSDWTRVVTGQTSDVYLLTQELSYNTMDGGGPIHLHKGIFMNDQPIEKLQSSEDFCSLEVAPFRGIIIGRLGASADIVDCALGGIVTDSDLVTENRILVSLPKTKTPDDYTWSVSYIVDGEDGVGDVEAYIMESLTLGDISFVYSTDRDVYGNQI